MDHVHPLRLTRTYFGLGVACALAAVVTVVLNQDHVDETWYFVTALLGGSVATLYALWNASRLRTPTSSDATAPVELASRSSGSGEGASKSGYVFTGRTRALRELEDWLDVDSAGVCLVVGRAGVGKSALARDLLTKSPHFRVDYHSRIALSLGAKDAASGAPDLIDQWRQLQARRAQSGPGRPMTVVLDAFDEIAEPDAKRIAAELADLADSRDAGLKIIVATRRGANERAFRALTRVDRVLDMDVPEYLGSADLIDYATHEWLRLAPRGATAPLAPESFAEWRLSLAHLMSGSGIPDVLTAIATARLRERPIAVAATEDRSVYVWDLLSGETRARFTMTDSSPVTAIAVNEIGEHLVVATGSKSGATRVWDLETQTALGPPLVGAIAPITALSVTRLGGAMRVMAGSGDGTVRLWDPATGSQVNGLETPDDSAVTAIAVDATNDQSLVVIGNEDGSVCFWNLSSRAPGADSLGGHGAAVTDIALTVVDRRAIAVTASDDGTVRAWDLPSDTPPADMSSSS